MKKCIGIKDVAQHANVSISTVSNVLTGNKYVSSELTRRVLQAVKDMDYEVNTLARGLKTGKTSSISVIVPSIVSVFFPRVLRGMHIAASKHNYTINIYETREEEERELECIQLMRSQCVDGIILSTCVSDTENYIQELVNLKSVGKRIPVVCFESTIGDSLDAVVVDNVRAFQEATEYLIGIGKKNIAHIAAPIRFTMGACRRQGYKNALIGAGLPVNQLLIIEGDYTPIGGYNCMRKLIERGVNIDAVTCGNDQTAIGAIRALLDAGIRIPEDVAVMGFDNNFPSSIVTPSLSTVSVPKEQIGEKAIELLLRRMENPDAKPKIITLDTQLIVRQSTDTQALSDWCLNDW